MKKTVIFGILKEAKKVKTKNGERILFSVEVKRWDSAQRKEVTEVKELWCPVNKGTETYVGKSGIPVLASLNEKGFVEDLPRTYGVITEPEVPKAELTDADLQPLREALAILIKDGQLDEGYEVTVESLAECKAMLSQMGDGELVKAARFACDKLFWSERVAFIGKVNGTKLWPDNLDIFITLPAKAKGQAGEFATAKIAGDNLAKKEKLFRKGDTAVLFLHGGYKNRKDEVVYRCSRFEIVARGDN